MRWPQVGVVELKHYCHGNIQQMLKDVMSFEGRKVYEFPLTL